MTTDTFRVSVEVSNHETGAKETVDAMVGSGTAIAVMPSSILRRLGIEPERTMHFRADDGSRVAFPVGHALFSVADVESPALVVFGPEDRCELGTNTLSALLLQPELEMGRLVPAVALLPSLLLLDELDS